MTVACFVFWVFSLFDDGMMVASYHAVGKMLVFNDWLKSSSSFFCSVLDIVYHFFGDSVLPRARLVLESHDGVFKFSKNKPSFTD